MSSEDIAIRVTKLSKCYQIYSSPRDRLKQFVMPTLQKIINCSPRKFYHEFWALKDVSFQVKKGETVGIIGRNGSGKSTLLQLICGTLSPTGGNIEAYGRVAALLELGSGFNPEFTGRENVYLNASVLGLSREEIDEKYGSIVSFADIGDFIEQPVKTYSSGMFVRLAFAIQANVEPEILIVDEALAVGDAYFVHRCMLRFHELKESGTTILFVSHDANAVRNLCNRAIWLKDGRLKEEGNSSRVVETYLAHLFGRQILTKNSVTTRNVRVMDQINGRITLTETVIPNIDRRLGDQKYKIVGVGLYDQFMNRILTAFNDNIVILRLTAQNNSDDPNIEPVLGYIFRNNKGQEIASTNSQIEGVKIPTIPKGYCHNIRIKITLPCLYPGSYSFSPTAGYITTSNQEIILSDRIENAIIIDIMNSKEIHTMMAFPSVIEVEQLKES